MSFEQAIFAFYDEYAIIDTDEHDDEVRFRLIGVTDIGALFVVYAETEGDTVRIRNTMSKERPFNFEKARRITPEEVEGARKAIEKRLGVKLPSKKGRPPNSESGTAMPVSIRLSPKVLRWAKREAKKRGVGYQTIINRALEDLAG